MANMYTGVGDLMLNTYTKGLTLGTTDKLNLELKLKLVNSGTETREVIINPSFAPSNPLLVINDTNIAYEVGANDLKSTVNINTIAEMLAYVKENPTEVLGIRIDTNNSKQLTEGLKFIRRQFAKKPIEEYKPFKSSPNQYDKNVLFFTEEFVLSNMLELSMKVPGRIAENEPTETVLSITFGASISLIDGFENRRALALQTPSVKAEKANYRVQ